VVFLGCFFLQQPCVKGTVSKGFWRAWLCKWSR